MEEQPLKPVTLNPPLNVTLITSLLSPEMDKLQDFFARTKGQSIGWDIETTPVKDYYWRRIRTIQVGDKTEQYVIDLLPLLGGDSELLYNCQGDYGKNLVPVLQNLKSILEPVLCTKDWTKVGVNLSFEYQCFYWLLGMRTQGFFCCSITEKCIAAGFHSLKDYGYYGMEEMVARYFHQQVDKSLQESFNLTDPLTWAQVEYAALDTRLPLGLKAIQTLIIKGMTYKGMVAAKNPAAPFLKNIEPLVTGDNLEKIVQVENDAIGAFEDMHIHGECIDRPRWKGRISVKKQEMLNLIAKTLDPIFLPYVGSKHDQSSDAEIEKLTADWKALTVISDAELSLKSQIRSLKSDPAAASQLEFKRLGLEAARKDEKERLKTICSEAKKRRTVIKNLAAECEGNALINYGSDTQLLKVIQTMKGLSKVTSMDDETLEKYEKYGVMEAVRKYHGLAKQIGTYGDQWATEWKTKPCKEEGWLHPGDGRLHCTFNQYDAATGRSSSEKPNGQNIEADPEVRSCFVADPPNESIRISTCCEEDTLKSGGQADPMIEQYCLACMKPCDTKPEEQSLITIDMSGAELCLIADMAEDPIWIGAFRRFEDVHSVGTELLYPDKWPKLALPDCAYYAKKEDGHPKRHKCKCPEHNKLRNATKACNFLIAYGGGPSKLAANIGCKAQEAKDLMATHRNAFPKIWEYLEKSGRNARILKKAFDIFGRRRLFPEPTFDLAREYAKTDREDKLRLDKAQAALNIETFESIHKRKPNKEELWTLTHRQPTNQEVNQAYQALHGSIDRQGKNHPVQSSNATIIKIAMGSGHCPEGNPYLWHVLPKYRARLIKMVHDELVISVPTRHSKQVAEIVGDCFKRAASERMKSVEMRCEYKISNHWEK